jgi:hypothetical protein
MVKALSITFLDTLFGDVTGHIGNVFDGKDIMYLVKLLGKT